MTTIKINNSNIQKKYTDYEIKMKFMEFLEKELKENKIDFYEISIEDIPEKTKKRLEKIDNLEFVDY